MTRKTVALALGGGGARSLAQIPVLEAFDELGVRPVAIAGSSFGAVIAAAYAAGLSGKDIRRAALSLAHDSGEVWRRLFAARATDLSAWLAAPLGNPLLLDAEKFCAQFLPPAIPEEFSALAIPLTVVATDLHVRGEAALESGPLRSAVASSIAIPGLMRPVQRENRILVDGAAVNPLPFDLLRGKADVVVAVDASTGPLEVGRVPDPFEALFATMHVIAHGIVERKLKDGGPDVLIRPDTGAFRLFDFFRASAILRAAAPAKAQLAARLRELVRGA